MPFVKSIPIGKVQVYNVYDTLYNGLNEEDITCMVAIEIRVNIRLTLANFYLYREREFV